MKPFAVLFCLLAATAVEGADHFRILSNEAPIAIEVRANASESGARESFRLAVPARRVVALSTTHVAAFEALGAADRLVGIGTPERVTSPTVRERIDRGEIRGVGDGTTINLEAIAVLEPDLVIASVFVSNQIQNRLEDLGIPLLKTAAYLETTPLGRAEWIRVLGAVIGEPVAAERHFLEVSRSYRELMRERSLLGRPGVLTGGPYGGIWYCAGGNSYLANLIRDAGGVYIWDDTSEVSVPRDFESILTRARNVDLWIDPGHHRDRASLVATDPRLRLFEPFREKRVFNGDKGANENGGLPLWERGSVRPDEVLADLMAIFRDPDGVDARGLRYYRRME